MLHTQNTALLSYFLFKIPKEKRGFLTLGPLTNQPVPVWDGSAPPHLWSYHNPPLKGVGWKGFFLGPGSVKQNTESHKKMLLCGRGGVTACVYSVGGLEPIQPSGIPHSSVGRQTHTYFNRDCRMVGQEKILDC